MRKKIGILTLLVMVLLVGVTTTVRAASFSFKVTKLEDGEDIAYKAGYSSHAWVKVANMSNQGAAYEAWVESDSTGYNITGPTAFTYPCTMKLFYKNSRIENEVYYTRLNISTSVTNFEESYFSGQWDPNGES